MFIDLMRGRVPRKSIGGIKIENIFSDKETINHSNCPNNAYYI